MLENVKSYIDGLSDISFTEYYMKYIMNVQDANMEQEFRMLTRRHTLTTNNIEHLIASMLERVEALDK